MTYGKKGDVNMVLEGLNEDRYFYDLCRRYKYYYNAYKKIGEVDKIYWDKDLKKAYDNARDKLNDTVLKMVMLIFIESGLVRDFKTVVENPNAYLTFLGKVESKGDTKSIIYGREFAELLMTLRREYDLIMDYEWND